MVRGKKKTPEQNERDGSYEKNPQRRKPGLPVPVKDRPEKSIDVLSDDVASSKWDELFYTLDQMGMLSSSYSGMMENYSVAYSLYSRSLAHVNENGMLVDGATGNLVRNPALIELHKAMDVMTKLQIEMGLTPASRSRVTVAEREEKVDPVLELLRKRSVGKN